MNRKVNWHYTDRCDFSCKYCFIKPLGAFEIRDIKLLEILSNHFDEINLVGGEPTIIDGFTELVDEAYKLFGKVSMVTNGYRIINDKVKIDLKKFNQIGISIDFFDKEKNKLIGRNRADDSLGFDDYMKFKNMLEENDVIFKINLMISKLNYKEDFNEQLKALNPARLKVLGIMDMTEGKSIQGLAITKEEFNHFIKNHPKLAEYTNELVIESPGEMINAYYMVTGDGYLFSNEGFVTKKIGSFFETDGEELIKQLPINQELYNKRYTNEGVHNDK